MQLPYTGLIAGLTGCHALSIEANTMQMQMDSGNFSLTINGELLPEKASELLLKGLKYEVERAVLSKVYTTLAGIPGKREGTKVLPKGFERDSIAFNTENAEAFTEATSKVLKDLGQFSVKVTQYVPAEGSEAKFENEKAAMLRHETANDLEVWLKDKIGFAGPSHGEDDEYNPEALKAIRVYAKTML